MFKSFLLGILFIFMTENNANISMTVEIRVTGPELGQTHRNKLVKVKLIKSVL